MATNTFPEKHQHFLQLLGKLQKELPGPMSAFNQLAQKASADGALNRKTKELIALGIGIHAQCEGCISFHVHDALKAGASRSEIVETIGVAIEMGGGPSAMYGCEALEALEQFEESMKLKAA